MVVLQPILASSRESNLLHQAHEVVEEPLLRDLPLIIPCGDGTKLHMETLPGRRDDLPLRGLHWSLHRAGEFRDGARVVAVREEKLVRAVDEVVVRESLEEFNGFHVMVVPTSRGWGPAGPVHGNIFGVTLSKSLPKRTSRSGIPSIVQRRHQIDQLFLFHVQPLPASSRSFKKPCQSLLRARAPYAPDEFIPHSPTTRGGFDAWARIRTWEPLREGILSPSPLTGLGYPRAVREAPGAVKPFPVQRPRAPVSQRLISSRTVPQGEAPLAQYFTKAFFQEVANRLNADPEWSRKAAAITAKVVLTCVDPKASFLIDVVNGTVSSSEVAADVPADFKFEGTYDAWTQLGRGEKDFQSLVMGGKIRFRGSMPKIMALMGVLTRITVVARDIPKDF